RSQRGPFRQSNLAAEGAELVHRHALLKQHFLCAVEEGEILRPYSHLATGTAGQIITAIVSLAQNALEVHRVPRPVDRPVRVQIGKLRQFPASVAVHIKLPGADTRAPDATGNTKTRRSRFTRGNN